jgi:hypothetical protein
MERGAEKSIDERMEDAKKSDIKAKNSMNVCRACVMRRNRRSVPLRTNTASRPFYPASETLESGVG